MSDFYFNKFPTVVYNDTTVRDISRNVRFQHDVSKSPTLFYPYEIKENLRADVLAHAYYEDSYLDWLIYLSNGIIDPYYGWYLGENDFNEFIIKKYGSFEYANKYVKFYRVDWDKFEEISVSYYNNNLPEVLLKYYVPNFGQGKQILSYKRRQEDWVVNTNKIYNIIVDDSTNFQNNEMITFSSNGQGQISLINENVITIQHISGNIEANTSIVGDISEANSNVTDVDLLVENITNDEYVYWQPVTYYEYELELNESRKHIYLIDANRSLEVSDELRKKLKE